MDAPDGGQAACTGSKSRQASAPRESAPTGSGGRAEGHAAAKARSRRKDRPAIDLDDSIEQAQQAAKNAAKALAKARAEARTERKRRARLIRKAGQLSPADLERIAVLKRTGWWDPSTGTPNVSASADGGPQPVATQAPTNPTIKAASSSDPRGSAISATAAADVGEGDKKTSDSPAAGHDAQATPCAQTPERDSEDGKDDEEQDADDANAPGDGDGEI